MELPIRRYTFLNHAPNSVKNKINKTTNKKINFATRPARTDPAAHEAHARIRQRGLEAAQPRSGSCLRASAADDGDPCVSERNRGGRTAGGVVRRRWLLRQRQRCQRVRLTQAHQGEPFIAAKDAARRGGDGHGGARPRHGRLRRSYDVMALVAHSTSFRVPPRG